MKFHAAAAAALRASGIDTMFGVMGDANMFIANSFDRELGGRFFSTAHESGAVLMAGGYAAVTGSIGVATVTHGAIANTISALLDGVRAGYPVVVVAGDTAATDNFNLQNVPQRDLVMPTGAAFEAVRAPQTVAADVAVAVRRARTEGRPVVLNVPADFQFADVDYQPIRGGESSPLNAWGPERTSVENAVSVISTCRRPVVVCGRGATTAPTAKAALIRLAERIGAPLATSLRAKDLFRGEAFDLGICGTLSNPIGLDAIAKADCLVVFGASLNALTADGGDLLQGKRIVQCDIDARAFGRYYPVDAAILGDCGQVADALVELLDEAGVGPCGYRSAALARRLATFSYQDPKRPCRPGTVDLREALVRLDEIVPTARTLVVDGGRFSHEALQIVSVVSPRAYVHALSVAQIGLSVGYGIGAAVGAPDRPTLVVTGDGGFMLGGLSEFTTAVRHGFDLIVAVMNDSAYGAEYYRFVNRSMDPSLTTFRWPDLATVAVALGGEGVTVRASDDFDKVREVIEGRTRPVLIDVKLDPAAVPDPGRH